MAGRRGTEKRAMEGRPVYVRLPAGLRERVDAAASAAGLSDAAWLRQLAAAATGADPAEARPSAPRGAPPPEEVAAVARLREVVAELTGALVQAAIRTRTDGADRIHAEIEEALPGVRAAVLDLDRLKRALMERAG